MDTDANGVIDFEEFLIAMAERRLMYDSTEDLRKVNLVVDLCSFYPDLPVLHSVWENIF